MRAIRILVVLALVGAALFVGFLYSGVYDIAASSPEPAWRAHVLETLKDRAIDRRVGSVPSPPPLDDPAMIRTGLVHFNEMCVGCHGAPGVPQSEIGMGLNPDPPNLSREAEEQSPSRLFWVLKSGIKMTGMPAFGLTHSDAQIWAMVAFLKQLPKLNPQQYASMLREAGTASSATSHESPSESLSAPSPASPPAQPPH